MRLVAAGVVKDEYWVHTRVTGMLFRMSAYARTALRIGSSATMQFIGGPCAQPA